jgi:DNA helicase HerA-like ATPase
LETIYSYIQDGGESTKKKGGKAVDDFEPQILSLLKFLNPGSNLSGTTLLHGYRMYHSPSAGDFVSEILAALEAGGTVILDLGNADDSIVRYFSDLLSNAVFAHQSKRFSQNELTRYFQLYFEEAHNLFSYDIDPKSIYNRFAKEGAKYQIGMVYSTQSPTTINRDLLAQTENFFVAHLASQDDVNTLAKVNIAYDGLKGDILRAKTRGYIRMLTQSHRFVVSVQARKFDPEAEIRK